MVGGFDGDIFNGSNAQVNPVYDRVVCNQDIVSVLFSTQNNLG
jgi:hypothetical protein